MSFYTVQLVYTGVAGTPWYMNLNFTEGGPGKESAIRAGVQAFVASTAASTWNGLTINWDGVIRERSELTGDVTGFLVGDPLTVAGGYNQQPLPFATQLVVQLITGGTATGGTPPRTTRVQGRINIPGLTEASMDNGTWQPSVSGGFATYLQTLDDAAGLAVYSPKASVAFEVSGIVGKTKPGILRSRRD